MNIALNIALGAVGSIVAVIVLYLLSNLYIVGYKKDFSFALNTAYTAVYQIENLYAFPKFYPLTVSQVDCLNQCAFAMFRSLSPLALWSKPKSKKLMITLLNDIASVCEISKFSTARYNGVDEWEARLEKIKEYFYKYPHHGDENSSTVRLQLDIISNLIKKKGIRASVRDAFGDLSDTISPEDLITDGFIGADSYKQKSDNSGLRGYCYTKNQLEKILRKEMR